MDGMNGQIEELFRLIANLLRLGTVFAVDPSAVRVRVASGGLESAWLPWFERRAGTTTTWNPPTLGEQVLMLCPGGDLAAAIVLTGLPSESNPAPSSNAHEHVMQYPDGARTVYDHATSTLTVTGVRTVCIEAADNILFDCPAATFTGRLTVQGLLTYQAGLSGTNGKGNNTVISGDIQHKGGQLASNGVVLDKHSHGGVQPGSARTQGPGAAS